MTGTASTPLAIAAGLAAATAYGVASSVQHDQVGQVAATNPLNPGLLGALSKRPIWLLGLAVDAAAVGLQAVALRYGPVVLVQLLVVGGLPIAVVLSARLAHVPLKRIDVVGLLLCTAGLAVAVPGSTVVVLGQPAAAKAWVAVGVGVGAAVLLLVGLSRRWPGCAPAAIGVAAGITAGASSVLLAISAGRIDDPRALFMTIVPYAAVALGLLTLLLSQAAFQTGPIGTPLAALSVTEPSAAVFLAVTVLDERLPSSALLTLTTGVGAMAAIAGVLVLSRSATLQRSLRP